MTRAKKWCAGLLCLTAGLEGSACAHPVDEIVQGAYLTLTAGRVELELDLSPGSKVAGSVLRELDTDGDGRASDAEARAYAQRVLAQSSLKLGSNPARWTLERVEAPPLAHLRTGNAALKVYAFAPRTDAAGQQTLSYQNRYRPAPSQWIANIFLRPGGGWTYAVTSQSRSNDGRSLTVTYTTAKVGR